jgi:ribokinase
MSGRVVVVGSLSMDLVVQTTRRPEKGETIRGLGFGMFAGGKGNNQALAAARCQADIAQANIAPANASQSNVAMIGRIGSDSFGETLADTLKSAKVDTTFLVRDSDTATGIAHITVDAQGQNYIVIAQQANAKLSVDDIDRAKSLIESSDVLLMQLEVPFAPLCRAAEIARAKGVKVILNPAPAPVDSEIPRALLANVNVFVPNQPEAFQLSGIDASSLAGARQAAKYFQEKGIEITVITMGELGAFALTKDSESYVEAYKVDAIDTTAAGDAFCGALASSLASRKSLAESLRFACAAGALATTKLGAEPSLPTLTEIERLLGR